VACPSASLAGATPDLVDDAAVTDAHDMQAPSIDAPATASAQEPTVARELLAGVVGAGVALVCLMPPLVHILTGPLGPAIGGFVAARWVKPGDRGRAVIALTVGATLAGLVGAVAFAIIRAEGAPSWFPSVAALGGILVGVAVYGAGLGAVGVSLGMRAGKQA
jgi:hypothetical protein